MDQPITDELRETLERIEAKLDALAAVVADQDSKQRLIEMYRQYDP